MPEPGPGRMAAEGRSVRISQRTTTLLVTASLVAVALLPGCSRPTAEEPALDPKVSPPAIAEAGVLKAGVDLEYPPFAGTDKDVEAGIDVDIASALASALGLKLELVQVTPSEAAAALGDGRVDIVLSVPLDTETLLEAALAGTYLTEGPGFFVFDESRSTTEAPSTGMLNATSFAGKRIGAQEGSPSFWALQYELGDDAVTPFPTLRAALEALAAGEVDVVVGSTSVASYIARDIPGVVYEGQFGPATALGVAVAPGNDGLQTAVRDALDQMATSGVFDTIRSTWLGAMPALELPMDSEGSAVGTSAPDAESDTPAGE